MQLLRAQELAVEFDKTLRAGVDHMLDLFNARGYYEESLFPAQIAEIEESDFIEFYLDN